MDIKPYDTWMVDDFYKLFRKTADEMNVKDGEVSRRVAETVSYLLDKHSPFLTAWVGSTLVGYAIAKRDDYGRKESSAHVAQLRVTVLPEYQGQGIGTDLVNQVLTTAIAEDVIHRIEVLNYETSIDDRHWFEKLGFQIEGKLRNRINVNGTYIDAYIMAFVLN